MRVLHIDAGGIYGGVETFLTTLARYRHLRPDMAPEFAVCFEGRLAAELEESGVTVHRLGEVRASNPVSVLRARRLLRQVLLDRPMDVVVCHMPWVQAIFGPVARRLELPDVCWLHSGVAGRHWVEKWARVSKPDLVLCNSDFCAATVPSTFPGIPTRVVRYPVAAAPPTDSPDRAALRSALNTPNDSIVIIQISRLETWKGQMLLLEALHRVRTQPDWTCWIVGGPQKNDEFEFFAELKTRAQKLDLLDRVRFPGQRSDVPALLRAADIFCQPNLEPEPFGIVFVEAMFKKLPVVTSALGGALEVVNEETGILVEPANPASLEGALRRLINDRELRQRLGAAGCLRADDLCGVETQLGKIAEVLSATRAHKPDCVRAPTCDLDG